MSDPPEPYLALVVVFLLTGGKPYYGCDVWADRGESIAPRDGSRRG
jgi:hypothetical protein